MSDRHAGRGLAPIGMRIKDVLRQKMPLFVTAYMGEHNLYIPTRDLVRTDAYQSQVIRIQYASPVGWAPEVEDEMVKGVLKVVTEVTGISAIARTVNDDRSVARSMSGKTDSAAVRALAIVVWFMFVDRRVKLSVGSAKDPVSCSHLDV